MKRAKKQLLRKMKTQDACKKPLGRANLVLDANAYEERDYDPTEGRTIVVTWPVL
jgi:hypothetical protein